MNDTQYFLERFYMRSVILCSNYDQLSVNVDIEMYTARCLYHDDVMIPVAHTILQGQSVYLSTNKHIDFEWNLLLQLFILWRMTTHREIIT